MGPGSRAVAAVVLLSLLLGAGGRVAAQRIERVGGERSQRAYGLTRLFTLLASASSGVAVAILFGSGVAAAIARGSSPPFVRQLEGVGALVLAIIVLSSASYLGVAPSLRRVRELDETPTEGARRWSRSLAFGFVPMVVYVVAVGWIATHVDNAVASALARGLLLAGITAGAPALVRRSLRSYPLDDATRRRLVALAESDGVEVRDIRRYRAMRQKEANAMFVGILPAHRHIFVSDYLLEHFTADEVDAVVAHELGHGKEHHLLVRVGLFTLAFVLTAIPLGSLLSLPLFWYLVFGLGFRFERRADDHAAALVGAAALTSALRHLAELNDTPLRTGRLWNRLGQHPGVAERIARLDPDAIPAARGRSTPI